jgi:hypothetical protein
MKVSKTFRLSEEAVEILDSKDNSTKYLEELILGGSLGGSSLDDKLDIIIGLLKGPPLAITGGLEVPIRKLRTNSSVRTKKIILGEIKSLEASADDSNQDPDYWREVSSKKNALWKEYHATEE